MVLLGLIAVWPGLIIFVRMMAQPSVQLDIPDAAPICLTMAVGFLAVIAAINDRARRGGTRRERP